MAKPVKCRHCGRRFADEMARFTHTKRMHPGELNERPVVAQPVGEAVSVEASRWPRNARDRVEDEASAPS